jgi:outer membrane murein-binding lipoprotein Lpp
MTEGSIHQISAAIGSLQSDVRSLKDSIDALNKIWGQREEAATAGRRIVHDKVDRLSADVVRLSADVENVSEDLTAIKPAIDDFKTARDQQVGAQKLGKRIWMAFIGIAGLAGGGIAELFHRLH